MSKIKSTCIKIHRLTNSFRVIQQWCCAFELSAKFGHGSDIYRLSFLLLRAGYSKLMIWKRYNAPTMVNWIWFDHFISRVGQNSREWDVRYWKTYYALWNEIWIWMNIAFITDLRTMLFWLFIGISSTDQWYFQSPIRTGRWTRTKGSINRISLNKAICGLKQFH